VREQVVAFGPGGRLTGVLTEPGGGTARSSSFVLSSNVGINHHVGINRIFVDLSRALARKGVASLRFDQGGLGDSAVRTDTLGAIERAVDDHAEAMKFVEARCGVARFVPVGFCSSVDPVHRLAVVDERVVGVCFIEAYSYKTRGFYLRYPLRFLEPARWRRVAVRRMPPLLQGLFATQGLGRYTAAVFAEDQVFVRDYPPPPTLRADYEAMSARGTRQLFFYVGGDSSYNHERQFLEFTGLRSLGSTRELVYLPEADHTLFQVGARREVISRICDWMQRGG
jgi:hypothetical protein